VCSGGDSKNWWTRSMFLGANRITNLNMNNSDKVLVGEILKMKLSEEALMSKKFNTNTHKCEAVNRSISVSLPKNTNFGRNVVGRLGSTVHRLNNGLGQSMEQKAAHLGSELCPRVQQ
jgi:hypothetical protein